MSPRTTTHHPAPPRTTTHPAPGAPPRTTTHPVILPRTGRTTTHPGAPPGSLPGPPREAAPLASDHALSERGQATAALLAQQGMVTTPEGQARARARLAAGRVQRDPLAYARMRRQFRLAPRPGDRELLAAAGEWPAHTAGAVTLYQAHPA